MKLRLGICGLGIGRLHAQACAKVPGYDLVALCDANPSLLREMACELKVPGQYENLSNMLREAKLDVVVIATPTALHAPMIRMAAEAGLRGVYCEKPIASNWKEVLALKDLCQQTNLRLVIGHQRRESSPYKAMRDAIDAGRIGDLLRVRGTCPGDLYTDGTHLMDSALFLCGDQRPEWVVGQVYRGRKATPQELEVNPFLYHGVRYGHLVEEGAMLTVGMPGDRRLELMLGTLWQPIDGYQHLEAVGTKGRLVRPCDGAQPGVLLETESGVQALDCDGADDGIYAAHESAAAYFAGQTDDHPMSFTHALTGYETMTAALESARTHRQVFLPCEMDEDPLSRMLRDGQMD